MSTDPLPRLQAIIGQGQYWQVFHAHCPRTGEAVAFKQPNPGFAQGTFHFNKTFDAEVDALKQVSDHPNIAECKGVWKGFQPGLAVELCPNGDLFDALSKGGLSEPVARHFASQLFHALDHCHSNGVLHGDVKPENICFGRNWDLKLVDFGFSSSIPTDEALASDPDYSFVIRGTEGYMAPEVKGGLVYEPRATDAFSAGVVLFIMVVGFPPFHRADASDAYWQRLVTRPAAFWAGVARRLGRELGDDFKDLVTGLLAPDAFDRTTVRAALQHSWFRPTPVSHRVVVEEMAGRGAPGANGACDLCKASKKASPAEASELRDVHF